jgi:hypothetical protein
MTQRIKSWRENRKQSNHERELMTRKETILYNLLNDLTTEESLNMFEDINSLFLSNVNSRLQSISEEKLLIEKFLSK